MTDTYPDDPRHPVREMIRAADGAPDCPVCGHVMIDGYRLSTGQPAWLCLHCSHVEMINDPGTV